MEALQHRIFQGRSSILLGASFVPLPPKLGATVVRISCDVPRETFGPLLALAQRIGFLLGDATPLFETARSQVFELGRRVLGEGPPSRSTLGQVIHAANRLAKGPACIVLDAVDAADEATLEALRQIIERPGWLKVPLVLGMKNAEPTGLAAELLAALTKAEGEDAVLHAPVPGPPASFSSTLLPPATRFVLRAASVVGPAFELSLLAELVAKEPLDVLEHLQVAKDLGLPIEDRGDGTFALDVGHAHVLRAGLLPSLRAVLHRRAAELLSPEPAAPAQEASAAHDVMFDTADVSSAKPVEAAAPAASAEPAAKPEPAAAPRPAPTPSQPFAPAQPLDNPARASEHLFESGDVALAAERALSAAIKAASLGAHAQAEAFARRALEAAIGLPDSDASRRLRTKALTHLGRLRLEGFAPTSTFDLASALQPLEAAKRALTLDDPPDQHVEISQLLAAVHNERGDAPSLDQALEELADTSRKLLTAGHPVHAARLLNDQAAVYMRMGDPVRAVALLEESRNVFGKRHDATARREIAETDHLIATVPLHVAARPGRADDALASALDHGLAAKNIYRQLGDTLAAARVTETMGRLELKRGRLDKALVLLQEALADQQKSLDLVGLARTTAALSDALVAAQRPEEALALLSDSVALNHQKGSVVGVAFNRRSFDALARGLGSLRSSLPVAEEVRARLEDAEAELGAIHLPGEGGPKRVASDPRDE